MKKILLISISILFLQSLFGQTHNSFAIAIECESELQQAEGMLHSLMAYKGSNDKTTQVAALSQLIAKAYEK